MITDSIKSAELVMPCKSFAETLSYFVDKLGFRIESIYPADAPRIAVISGFGTRLRLDASADGPPPTVHLNCEEIPDGPLEQTAPNGATVHFVAANQPLELPRAVPSLVVQRIADSDAFGVGRAGMQYRDLIPDRYGGRFIASHIRIPEGGPVPDDVHHHHIAFQLIFCVNGWVKVVYEDQGPPMVLEAGDCFLQPPHIRHRVLESSAQMEVMEIACPAEHETRIDHEMALPTTELKPKRVFGGQRFVFHQGKNKQWSRTSVVGLERQLTEIENATNGVVAVNVLRATDAGIEIPLQHEGELRFLFMLSGQGRLDANENGQWSLGRGDSCAIPPATSCRLSDVSADFSYLEVQVPGNA